MFFVGLLRGMLARGATSGRLFGVFFVGATRKMDGFVMLRVDELAGRHANERIRWGCVSVIFRVDTQLALF